MLTTLTTLFVTLFDRQHMEKRARELGAVDRIKELHPADVLLAVVRCARGDEKRSIATARREYQAVTGQMPEESSFYERLTPGLADLGWETFLRALSSANRVQRQAVARALGLRVRDVRAVDASRVTLPARAAAHFPSTDSKLGGFKITATLSVLEDLLVAARISDARQHDRKVLRLPEDLRSVLWIKDRGYSDHRLFAQIADGLGYFIIRLKSSSLPTVTTIRSGLAKAHRRKPLSRDLPVFGVVDLDARFSIGSKQNRIFRVVGIPVAKNKTGQPAWIWLATNLPARVPPATVGAFYRLRWGIENLFRALKTVGRLDQLQSGNRAVIRVFIAATLIALALSQAICAWMRTVRPRCEPSLQRVFALLLCNLPAICAALETRDLTAALTRFADALWREGVNPNPGRPYARERHLAALAGRSSGRIATN